LAKLIVWAATRELAIERMHRALLELTIDGIETSRDFHLRLMEDGEFRRGEIEIQWLERRLTSIIDVKPPSEAADAATIIAALLADADRKKGPVPGARYPVAGTRGPGKTELLEAPLYNECGAEETQGWKKAGRL